MEGNLSVDDACDAVLHDFEHPGILDAPSSPKVDALRQKTINTRRKYSRDSLKAYQDSLKE